MACTPRLAGSLIGALDIKRIKDASAQLVLRCVWMINKELGKGPSSHRTVIQRLHRLMDEGSVTREQILEVEMMFLDVDISTPEDEFLNEIVPILKRRATAELLSEASLGFGNKTDITPIVSKIQMLDGVGVIDRSVGDELTATSILEEQNRADLLPTGVEELDLKLEGGIPRGGVTIILAPTSGGKTAMMVHQAATAMRRGMNVAMATLELSTARWKSRVLANLTGIPSNSIFSGQASELAAEKFAKMSHRLGRFFPKQFPADETTIDDILLWVKELEQEKSIGIDFFVLDYLLLCKHAVGHDSKNTAHHAQIGATVLRLKNWLEQTQKWGVTGAQARRGDPKDKDKKKLKSDEIGDSYKQSQHAQTVIAVTKSEDETECTFFVAKNRDGAGSGQLVGPLPTNFPCGRIAPVFDE